ncbi:MAG: hypothetical protein HOQ24_11115 [Mycobacteriaceae bacterium]|nr:hypothetical protein [Mycobacteriaceae bacterium]
MSTFLHTVSSLWQVLLIAILFGAGLPAVFALSIRLLSTEIIDSAGAVRRRRTASIAGMACLLVVVAAIITGILYIMKGFLAHTFGIHMF